VSGVLDAALPGGDGLRLGEARAAFPGDWGRFRSRWEALLRVGLVRV
jgi:hypothetical protein